MRILLGLVLIAGCGGRSSNSPIEDETWKEPRQEQTRIPEQDERVVASTQPEAMPASGSSDSVEEEVPRCTPVQLSPTPSKEFEKAESFYKNFYLRFRIRTVPKSQKEGDRVLGRLVRLKDKAQGKYAVLLKDWPPEEYSSLKLAGTESAYWRIAALVRTGDVLSNMAHVVTTIPTPKTIISRMHANPALLTQYHEMTEALIRPLRDQAAQHWELALSKSREWCIDSEWTRRAEEHLRRP